MVLMSKKILRLICPFCNGFASPVYKMGDYDICMCECCGTGQVFPLPSETELVEFYKGFLFSANLRNLETILASAPKLFSLLNLPRNDSLKMLDVGGGGGFYAKAFEVAGYGESTYIDLDGDACTFAREKVGLANVLNQDATMLTAEEGSYDFIMCRHLIEHLINPTSFVLKLRSLLKEGGTLFIVCPNGDSLEYFAYPHMNLRGRVAKISESSHLSKIRAVGKLLSGKMLHGIDPPRHLWAISRKGMRRFLAGKGINAEIKTFPLTDHLYSPYYSSKTFYQKVAAFFGDVIAAKIAGGTHLSVVIRSSLRAEDANVVRGPHP